MEYLRAVVKLWLDHEQAELSSFRAEESTSHPDTLYFARTTGLERETFLDKMLQVKRSAGDFPHWKPTNQYLAGCPSGSWFRLREVCPEWAQGCF